MRVAGNCCSNTEAGWGELQRQNRGNAGQAILHLNTLERTTEHNCARKGNGVVHRQHMQTVLLLILVVAVIALITLVLCNADNASTLFLFQRAPGFGKSRAKDFTCTEIRADVPDL